MPDYTYTNSPQSGGCGGDTNQIAFFVVGIIWAGVPQQYSYH